MSKTRFRGYSSGWKVVGLSESYFLNKSKVFASHKIYGQVWGNLEEGFKQFYKNHTPKSWEDII